MSANKAAYPHRPPPRHLRPKKPGKGQGRPSSHSGGRKSKTWSTDGSLILTMTGMREVRLNAPWWRSPMMKEARLKAASLRQS